MLGPFLVCYKGCAMVTDLFKKKEVKKTIEHRILRHSLFFNWPDDAANPSQTNRNTLLYRKGLTACIRFKYISLMRIQARISMIPINLLYFPSSSVYRGRWACQVSLKPSNFFGLVSSSLQHPIRCA